MEFLRCLFVGEGEGMLKTKLIWGKKHKFSWKRHRKNQKEEMKNSMKKIEIP